MRIFKNSQKAKKKKSKEVQQKYLNNKFNKIMIKITLNNILVIHHTVKCE